MDDRAAWVGELECCDGWGDRQSGPERPGDHRHVDERGTGIALALGVAAGSFCWAMLAAVGLSALLASYAAALTAIKIAGGLYLRWLSYKSFRSAASAHDLEGRIGHLNR
jgi:hypothetical protein